MFKIEQKMNAFRTVVFQSVQGGGLAKVSEKLVNRASLFGDGVFETIIFSSGKIRFAREHEERLQMGLHILKIEPSGLSVLYLENFLQRTFPAQKDLRIRWNVYRGGLGKYTPESNMAEDLILVQSHSKPVKIKQKAYICRKIQVPPSCWSHCKTLNSLPYVMANIDRVEKKMDEVILLSEKGMVSEAGAANIFWKKGNDFYTPSLSCNGVAGVGRRIIMEKMKKEGVHLTTGEFQVEDLMNADMIFTSNVTGIAYIARLENQTFDTQPLHFLEGLFGQG